VPLGVVNVSLTVCCHALSSLCNVLQLPAKRDHCGVNINQV
jgi:hypothetical protein